MVKGAALDARSIRCEAVERMITRDGRNRQDHPSTTRLTKSSFCLGLRQLPQGGPGSEVNAAHPRPACKGTAMRTVAGLVNTERGLTGAMRAKGVAVRV